MSPLGLDTNSFSEPLIKGINDILPKLPAALLGLLFGLVLIRLLSWGAQLLLSLVRLPKGLRGIIVSVIDALLSIFLFITLLQALGLQNVALVFSGSIAALGLALAAGASTLAADVLAGIFLAKDRDFSIGDQVVAGENKTEGIIESMDMRRTRIRSTDGCLHVIPNSVIERKEWIVRAKKADLKR